MEHFDRSRLATPSADDFERRLMEEFQNAWQQAIAGISPPDMESFLNRLGGETSELAERLKALDSDFRNRLAVGKTAKPSGASTAKEQPALEKTVIGPAPDNSLDTPHGDALAGTASWVLQEEPDAGPLEIPLAATVIGDTGEGEADPSVSVDGESRTTQSITQRIAGYEILGTLGRGGMGVVYRARQIGLNRYVALKMILDGRHVAPEILNRFRVEAEAVAQLQHPNIVQIYDIGMQEGLPFFSLELVDGPSLAAEMAGQPMPAVRAAELIETLARAMQYAHVRGIVHRDLKPANVLLTKSGVPKVTDFGLVKRLEAKESEQTKTGVIMGTPSYMAPEQAWGQKDVGPLADVYSLGATLYALLTARPPFLGPTPAETVMQLRNEEPVPPSRLQPNLSRDLETICLKCLHKEQDKRYASAEELADDLRRFRNGEPILARPVGRAERVWRWCRRNPKLATTGGIATVLAVCLMIGGYLSAFLINKERNAAIEAQGIAEDNEKLAVENEEFAEFQGETAMTAFELLIERLPRELKNVPRTESLKRNLLLTAMDGLKRIIDVGGERKDYVTAKAYAKLGEVLLEMGQTQDAQDQFLKSHAILLELAESDTETPESTRQLRLGRSYRNLARVAEHLEGAKAAFALYLKSLELREAALPAHHDPFFVKQEIAECCGDLGRIALDFGRAHEAMDYFTRALAYRDEWVEKTRGNEEALRAQAGARRAVGHGLLYLGETAKAAERYQQALDSLSALAKKNPLDTTDRTNAALCYNDLGTARLLSGDTLSARKNYEEAMVRLEGLFRENNLNRFVLRKLGQSYHFLATACEQLNDTEEAKIRRERNVKARREMARVSSNDRASRQDLMLALALYGQLAEADKLAGELAKEAPHEPDALYIVACTYSLCASAYDRNKSSDPDLPSVEEFRQKAVETLRAAVDHGYHAKAMIRLDPDLAAARKTPEFQTLWSELEQNEKKVAENKAD